MHCFSGDLEMARECARRGYHLSFAGTVTFKNAKGLRDALAVTPLDLLLVETDAPYLTPVPHRGKRNEPAFVAATAARLAARRATSAARMAELTTANAHRLFGLRAQ